jgi:regulator of cell morphogenesis and NO signaling
MNRLKEQNISIKQTLGEIVTQNYRAADVFEKYRMDFCCKGNHTLEEACAHKKIEPEIVLQDLNAVLALKEGDATDYQSWPPDLLADYIEKKHHKYVEEKIPVLKEYLNKLCQAHGKQHPELTEINRLFNETAGELTAHMKKEEFILFPFIRKLAHAKRESTALSTPPFQTVQNPVHMMMQEHDAEGERFNKIAELSAEYTTPADGCNTYKVTFALLKEFEADLHLHIHLENSVLFPKAIEMESALRQ